MHDRFERDKFYYVVLGMLVRNGFLKLAGRHRTWVRKDTRITILAGHTLRKVKPDGRTYVHRDVSLQDAWEIVTVAILDGDFPD
jgi:hypothetical protein